MLDIFVVAVLGILAGGIVNLLADALPYRRKPGVPAYADGTPRPPLAWLGVTAFLFNKRQPQNPQPDESRSQPHLTGSKLSWRYPLTELLTAGLMLLALSASAQIDNMNSAQLFLYLLYMPIFALITVIDIEHKLILFVVIIPSIILGLLDAYFVPQPTPNFNEALIGGAFGFGVFFFMYLGGIAFTFLLGKMRGETIDTVAFGYGDVMLFTFTGILVGLHYAFLAMFITVVLGALGAVVYLFAQRLLSGKYDAFAAIPYGPYIVIATIIMLLYGDVVWQVMVAR